MDVEAEAHQVKGLLQATMVSKGGGGEKLAQAQVLISPAGWKTTRLQGPL